MASLSTITSPKLLHHRHLTSTTTTTISKPPLSFHFFTPKRHRLPFHSLSFSSSTTTPRASASATPPQPRRRPPYIPNKIPDPNYVRVFDTTLRDGEQSPGATMTSKEKLDIARQLAKLGVDIIEAGFPASSKDDFEAVSSIAKEVGNNVDDDRDGYVPVICGLSRCNEKDIRTAWEAVKYAVRPRIHTFIATSDIHMKYKLKKSEDEVVDIATSMVRFARGLGCDDVEFSPEDAGRSCLSLFFFCKCISGSGILINPFFRVTSSVSSLFIC